MKKIINILLLILSITTIQAREYTNNFFGGGVSIDGIIYSADFRKLPNTNFDSPGFSSAFAISPSIFLTFEKRLSYKLFGNEVRFYSKLAYSQFSAEFSETEFIGYDIDGNDYNKLSSKHILEATIPSIMFENGFTISLLKTGLSLKLGMQTGYLLSPTYLQKEILLTENRHFETGSDIRKESDGAMPDANNFYFAISTGLRYLIFQNESVEIYPELNFYLGLSDLVQNVQWKSHNLQLGIAVLYNQPIPLPPVKQPIQPSKPHLPLPIPPAKPKKLDMDLIITANGNAIENNGNILIDITDKVTYTEFYLPKDLYYHKDQINSYVFASDSIIKNIANILRKDNKLLLSIIAKTPVIDGNKESQNILNERLTTIKNKITEYGVNEKQINVKSSYLTPKVRYNELYDEYRKIEFQISSKSNILVCKMPLKSKNEYSQTNLKIIPKINAGAGIKEFTGTALSSVKEGSFGDFDQRGVELFINKSFLAFENDKYQKANLKIYATVEDNENKIIKKTIELNIIPKFKTEYIDVSFEKQSKLLALAYSHFDKTGFYSINDIAIPLIKQAIAEGKKIILTASTDDLGNKEYNINLAQKRMQKALKLLDLPNTSNIELIYKTGNNSHLQTAYQRIISRAVYVEIID